MITEEQAREMLIGDRARALLETVRNAHAMWISDTRRFSPRTRASIISDHMVSGARERFEPLDGIRFSEINSNKLFVVDEALTLNFKMLSRGTLQTRNFPTKQQRHLWSNGTFEGMANYPLVTCGYVWNRTEGDFEKIVIARHADRKLEWSIDLHQLVEGVVTPTRPIFPDLPAEIVSLPRIARKAKEAERE